jgi:hypothetical protein
MVTYSREEKVRRTIEYRVPAEMPYGACWNQVVQAINAAIRELREAGALVDGEEPSDDRIWIQPNDDSIVIVFEAPEVTK